jgi:hypothetical protein
MSKGVEKLKNTLGETSAVPPLRRGKGIQLSVDERTNAPTHERTNAPTHERTNAPTHERTNAPTHERTNAPTHERTNAPTHERTNAAAAGELDKVSTYERVNRGYKLREDLIHECRLTALTQKRKLYEVMEDALAEYLERHRKA